ncbi:MAG: acetyl-CoA carboxylase biotin carboxyl carrier protein [Phycisphaerae bacterium]
MDMSIEQIRSLVELMAANDLSRIELREGEAHILLRRGQALVAAPVSVGSLAAAPVATPSVAPMPTPAVAATAPNAPATENEVFIRSPMVGTYYASPDPESPAFVNPGSVVSPESVVCLVEAMKVFNEIKAEVSGRITKVLVKNAQAVEFDQPLFAVAAA